MPIASRRKCPASGLRIGARFVVRNSANQYVTTCPTCDITIPVDVSRENRPYPLGPVFTRRIMEHNRSLYLGVV